MFDKKNCLFISYVVPQDCFVCKALNNIAPGQQFSVHFKPTVKVTWPLDEYLHRKCFLGRAKILESESERD